jgi:sulfite exporter TauE/SafE
MDEPLLSLSLALAHCKAVAIGHGPLLLSMFLAGLVGSASHCAPMCGPFVLAQTGETMARLPVGSGELRRLAGTALLPYHAGRAITYILLAVLLSLPLQLMSRLPELRWIPAIALLLGALLFLLLGFRGLRGSLESGLLGGVGFGTKLGQIARPLFAKPWGWRGVGLGMLLGFLPCGLLYAALGAAAATSDPLAAAMSMAVFTLGTFPMLWLVGYLGGWAQRRWNKWARPVLPVIALVNAMVLGGMAWNWIAT